MERASEINCASARGMSKSSKHSVKGERTVHSANVCGNAEQAKGVSEPDCN